mmetsp:Transcript_18368/g.57396  ORF Transcript_18368/g.57396 Transcript_18368/m.57396 type:complete len:235 (-) Transcript_18368:32-736(-)
MKVGGAREVERAKVPSAAERVRLLHRRLDRQRLVFPDRQAEPLERSQGFSRDKRQRAQRVPGSQESHDVLPRPTRQSVQAHHRASTPRCGRRHVLGERIDGADRKLPCLRAVAGRQLRSRAVQELDRGVHGVGGRRGRRLAQRRVVLVGRVVHGHRRSAARVLARRSRGRARAALRAPAHASPDGGRARRDNLSVHLQIPAKTTNTAPRRHRARSGQAKQHAAGSRFKISPALR